MSYKENLLKKIEIDRLVKEAVKDGVDDSKWTDYVLAGGAALAAIPLLAGRAADTASLPASEYMTIFATAGFAGGLIYWVLAGRGA